ncbi:MAG: ATP-binding response regulator [Anaerolineae bacterium]
MAVSLQAEARQGGVLALADERLSQVTGSLLGAMSALVLALWIYLCWATANMPLSMLASLVSLGMVGSWVLRRSHPRLTAVGMVLGLVVATLSLHLALRQQTTYVLLLLPSIAAACLFGPPWAAFVATTIAAALLAVTGPDQTPAAAMLVAIGAVTWAGFRPWHQMLCESFTRGLQERDLVVQLRDRQGKLNRTVKALDTAYRLLESSNRALAVASREAEELRELKSRFAANLSHELRTPLNIILGFSELIYRSPSLYGSSQWSDTLRRDLAQIQRNAGYLSGLLDDILDLARMDANAMPVRRDYRDLHELIDQAASGVASLAQEKGLSLEIQCEAGLPAVYVDDIRLRQILYNLLTNAIRATSRGGVQIVATLGEGEVIVTIHDSGPGVPPEAHELIFDEFRRLEDGGYHSERGKGLGLPIAKRLVQMQGGRIWVESAAGEGSSFSFSISLAPKSASRLGWGRPAPLPPSRRKPVLAVIAANDSAPAYLRRRLEEYDVAPVGSREDLLRSWDELRPRAVVEAVPPGTVDLGLAAFQERLPEAVPLVQFSLPSPHTLLDGAGFDLVLSKPVTQERLLAAIRSFDGRGEGLRILIADDDRGFIQLVDRMLQAGGCVAEVIPAYTGREALRLARRSRPDLVLMDLVMPQMSGLEVLRRLRANAELRQTPVIAVTAATARDDESILAPAAFSVSARGPFTEAYLLSLVRAAISPHEAMESNE